MGLSEKSNSSKSVGKGTEGHGYCSQLSDSQSRNLYSSVTFRTGLESHSGTQDDSSGPEKLLY